MCVHACVPLEYMLCGMSASVVEYGIMLTVVHVHAYIIHVCEKPHPWCIIAVTYKAHLSLSLPHSPLHSFLPPPSPPSLSLSSLPSPPLSVSVAPSQSSFPTTPSSFATNTVVPTSVYSPRFGWLVVFYVEPLLG